MVLGGICLHIHSTFLDTTPTFCNVLKTSYYVPLYSHTAEDTKVFHLQKPKLQKPTGNDTGEPDMLIHLWDMLTKTAVMCLAPNMEKIKKKENSKELPDYDFNSLLRWRTINSNVIQL